MTHMQKQFNKTDSMIQSLGICLVYISDETTIETAVVLTPVFSKNLGAVGSTAI